MPKKDINQLAKFIVDQAAGDAPRQKLSARQEAGRKGGLKGGKGRMEKLTDAQRTELAVKAAAARWKTQ
jgi:hypothetical protein